MSILENRIITLFIFCLILYPGSVIAIGFSAGDDVIWEKGANLYVKYADQGKSDFGTNDHPVELKTEEIETILKSLKVRQKDKEEKIISVFSDQQANMLGRYLATGLRNAKPDQDIIFAMEKSTPRAFSLLNPFRFFVAGRAFYKDEKLNIIIGDYDRRRNDAYESIYDPTHVGTLRYHFDHGSRSKRSKGFNKAIVTVDGIENKQLNGTRREDWLVIDVKAASEAVDRMTRMREKQETARKRNELRQILGSEETNRPVNEPRSLDSLEERLTILKRLRDKGLITEDEYTQKRKQILDDL